MIPPGWLSPAWGNWQIAFIYITKKELDPEEGIQPWVTLFRWDLPQALQRQGGWQNPETARRFEAYAEKMAELFRGRVRRWFTFNEPQCFIGMGYGTGEHAPGLKLDGDSLSTCWETFCQAHSLGQKALHRADGENLVGVASTGAVCYPASQAPEDVEAARQGTFALPLGPRAFHSAIWERIITAASVKNIKFRTICNGCKPRSAPKNHEKRSAVQESQGRVAVLDGRQPACVLRLALRSLPGAEICGGQFFAPWRRWVFIIKVNTASFLLKVEKFWQNICISKGQTA